MPSGETAGGDGISDSSHQEAAAAPPEVSPAEEPCASASTLPRPPSKRSDGGASAPGGVVQDHKGQLEFTLQKKLQKAQEDVDNLVVDTVKLSPDGHHGHGHGAKPASIVTAVVSGFINFLLMFGLCCAFGLIMFDEKNRRWQSLGVKMSLCTSFLCGLIVSCFSRIQVAIAGPDLNPIVFLGTFVATMAPQIAKSLNLQYPGDENQCVSSRRLEDFEPFDLGMAAQAFSARMLGGGGSCGAVEEFCVGDDYNSAACELYQQELVTTTIFTVALSSLVLSIVLYGFAKFNIVRYMSFVPTSISEAFLSCVGYKVFAYALKFCKYKPQQFLPAAAIGVLMYFMKALHIGNPCVVLPSLLLLPLGIFHALVAAGVLYDDLDHARAEDMMFPKMDNINFWIIWQEGLFDGSEWKFQYINFSAWAKTIPDLLTMIVVVMIDCLLKVKNTENKLPVQPQADYEVKLYSGCNALMFLCGSPCGYMQLKFNVINFGILGNTKDRRGGIVYACLCAVCFFWTIEVFNYLPRFFLSMLLFFAGAGFVAENLWGSRKFLSFREWLEILVILIAFIVSGQLLVAVVAGLMLTSVSFITKYAKVPVLSRPPIDGGNVASHSRRSPLVRLASRHIADAWFFVIPTKGYIFFASAKQVSKIVHERLYKNRKFSITIDVPSHQGGDDNPLGIGLEDGEDGKALWITDIYQGGLIDQWNAKNPRSEVQIGDRIDKVTSTALRASATNVASAGHRSVSHDVKELAQAKGHCDKLRKDLEQSGKLEIKIHHENHAEYERLRFVIIDAARLDGLDASASLIFKKMVAEAEENGARFIWAGLKPEMQKSLLDRGIIANHNVCFSHLKHAVIHIEEKIWQYREDKLRFWLNVHPQIYLRHAQVLKASRFEPFMHIFETDAERRGCPWAYCTVKEIKKFRTVLWGPSMDEDGLFLIHSGSVGVYDNLEQDDDGIEKSEANIDYVEKRAGGWRSSRSRSNLFQLTSEEELSIQDDQALPTAVYEHGWFVNRNFILQRPSKSYGVAIKDGEVLSWNREQWSRMQREQPLMTAAILKGIMRQQAREEDLSKANISMMESKEDPRPKKEPSMTRITSTSSMRSDPAKLTNENGAARTHKRRATTSKAKHEQIISSHLPQETRLPLMGMYNVRALEKLGLWEHPKAEEAQELPKLPVKLEWDLKGAFKAYAKDGVLQRENIEKALMFGGIFGVELNLGDGNRANAIQLDRSEFLSLAHEALLVRFSKKQKETMLGKFQDYDDDESGTLDRNELSDIFATEFNMNAADVDAVARDVSDGKYDDNAGEGQVSEEGFLWIVARLTRIHANDYMLLKTLRYLTGDDEATGSESITLDMLKKRATMAQATDSEWQELFWVMHNLSCLANGDDAGASLDFSELLTMVLAQQTSDADPLPRLSLEEKQWMRRSGTVALRGSGSKDEASQDVARRQSLVRQISPLGHRASPAMLDMRGMVVDQRELDDEMLRQRVARLSEAAKEAESATRETDACADQIVPSILELEEPSTPAMTATPAKRIGTCRTELLKLLEDPESSPTAYWLNVGVAVMIVSSIVNQIAASLTKRGMEVDWKSPFWIIDFVLTILFTIEFTTRVVAYSPTSFGTFAKFMCTPRNLLDFFAITPAYLELLFSAGDSQLTLLRVVRLLRLSQLARMGRLGTRWSLVPPLSAVLVVIWGIYLKEGAGSDYC